MSESLLSHEFLCNVSFLVRACGPDPDGEADEIEAAARVAERVQEWLHVLAPEGLPECQADGCDLPATDWHDAIRRCPYHFR